jgi:hypothetical protein
MPEPEQRTIDELLTRYEFEPTIQDVFVEGDADKCLIQWFLDEKGKSNVAVYVIDSVEVSAAVVEQFNLEINNRGRLITLAYMLEQGLGNPASKLLCVADKDFDTILKEEHQCGLLVFTDYSCMEMYAFNPPTIGKLIKLLARRSDASVEQLMAQFANVLQELFLIRLTNRILHLNLTAVAWERCCSIVDTTIVLDVKEYIRRYLNSNALLGELERFLSVLEEYRTKLDDDPRYQIQGHDLTDLLAWYIRHGCRVREIGNPKIVERALFTCIDMSLLEREKMFGMLLDRFSQG